jgi:hypothetical protein
VSAATSSFKASTSRSALSQRARHVAAPVTAAAMVVANRGLVRLLLVVVVVPPKEDDDKAVAPAPPPPADTATIALRAASSARASCADS